METPRSRTSVRSPSLDLENRLVACASGQLGVFTAHQAAEVGLSENALHWRKRAGLIVPIFPGIYRLAAVEESSDQRTLAGCLAVRDSIVGGVSAALLHGLPVGFAYAGKPTLIVPSQRTVRLSGLDVHRTRHPYLTQPWLTVRMTQVSSTLISLAGVLSQTDLARCLDHAVAHRLVSVARVLQEAEARPASRFVGRAPLLAELHARVGQKVVHRSRYEQKVDEWIRQSRLPKPVSNFQVPIIGRNTSIEVDKAWPEDRVALEISPFFTHGSAATQRRDMQRRVWLQESQWRIVEATDEHLVNRQSFAPIIESLERLLGVCSFP